MMLCVLGRTFFIKGDEVYYCYYYPLKYGYFIEEQKRIWYTNSLPEALKISLQGVNY